MSLDLRNPEVLSRVRQAITDQPWLEVDQALAQLEREEAAIQTELILAAMAAEQDDWIAAGRPGGHEAFTSGTWRTLEADEAARLARETLDGTIPEKTFGEVLEELKAQPFDDGHLSPEAIANVEAHWKAKAQADWKANEAAGYSSPVPLGTEE